MPKTQFKIDFKPNADTTAIQCSECPHNVFHMKKMERQLQYLIDKSFISNSTSPWRFPYFIVQRKKGAARIVFDCY